MKANQVFAVRRNAIVGVLFLCAIFSCVAFGSLDKSAKEQKFVIRGMIHIVGNEPHTSVVIRNEDESKAYAVIPGAEEKALRELQGSIVDFTVVMAEKNQESFYLAVDGAVRVISWKIVK